MSLKVSFLGLIDSGVIFACNAEPNAAVTDSIVFSEAKADTVARRSVNISSPLEVRLSALDAELNAIMIEANPNRWFSMS
jgi:hypothetical protein